MMMVENARRGLPNWCAPLVKARHVAKMLAKMLARLLLGGPLAAVYVATFYPVALALALAVPLLCWMKRTGRAGWLFESACMLHMPDGVGEAVWHLFNPYTEEHWGLSLNLYAVAT